MALKMLTGDRAKYLGLIFTIAFSSFLLANQTSIFAGILARTGSQIVDVSEADIWVMDQRTEYIDEVKPLTENDLYRVRGVPGVQWAVRLFKGPARATAADGKFRQVILMGLDDATLVGAPRNMILGSLQDLQQPDAVIVDLAGHKYFFPNEPLQLGKSFEMNDRRAKIVGIAKASAPFTTFPVMFTRYSQAVNYVGRERNQLSFVLVKAQPGVPPEELSARIACATGLRGATGDAFYWQTIRYYLRNTGIPVNFGITVSLAFVVGAGIAGQTFYLFTLENLQQFGALKAIGMTDRRIIGMILLQAMVVGALGFALGMGMAAGFFASFLNYMPTRGIILRWQSMVGAGMAVFVIVI